MSARVVQTATPACVLDQLPGATHSRAGPEVNPLTQGIIDCELFRVHLNRYLASSGLK